MGRRITSIVVVAVVAGSAAGAGVASAVVSRAIEEPSAKGVISACYATGNGAIRMVNAGAGCRAGERKLTWNQGVRKPVVHEVGAPGEVAYTGEFMAYDSPPFGNLSYYKDASRVVHLTGLTCLRDGATCATQTTSVGTRPIFTLPRGFRPARQQVFTALSVGLSTQYYSARVDVTKGGVVEVVAPPEAGMDWVSFDGVSFLAAG
jgi:hypothetical protein